VITATTLAAGVWAAVAAGVAAAVIVGIFMLNLAALATRPLLRSRPARYVRSLAVRELAEGNVPAMSFQPRRVPEPGTG
jgi:hypothetical protein